MRQTLDHLKLPFALCAALFVACSEQTTGQQAASDSTVAVSSNTGGTSASSVPLPGLGTASYQERTDIDEQELGLPLYPGATPLAGGTWRMTDAFSEGADSLTSLRLHTTDAIEKVTLFYRERLRPGPQQSFEFESATGKALSLTAQTRDHTSLNVVLRQQSVGTRIDINVMGSKRDKKNDPHPDDG